MGVGVCTWGKGPRNCDSSRVAQDTVESRFRCTMGPKWGFGVGETAQKRPRMAHGTPRVGSSLVQNVRLACDLSSKVDSAPGAGSTRGFGGLWGHFGPGSACLGPFSGPGANGAILSSKVATDGSRRGVQAKTRDRPLFDCRRQGYPPTKFGVLGVLHRVLGYYTGY